MTELRIPNDTKGFTLVEAIIVILAAIIAVLIPGFGEGERQRLQALANAEPWEVFELRAEPVSTSFTEDEDIVIRCKITNPTDFPLSITMDNYRFYLSFSNIDYFLRATELDGPELNTVLAPQESASFDTVFYPLDPGVFEANLVYGTVGLPVNLDSDVLLPEKELLQSQVFKLNVTLTEPTGWNS